MNVLFYISGIIAVISAVMVITRTNAMYALLYLVLLFLSMASALYSLGGTFAALLLIIVYAGAIIVLFVFIVMIINAGSTEEVRQEHTLLSARAWVLPSILAIVLAVESVIALTGHITGQSQMEITPKAVGISLFTDYILGVELASFLLLAALTAGFHFGILPGRFGGNHE